MQTEPLQPFSPPTILLKHLNLPAGISAGTVVMWFLYLVFFIWAIYTAVAIYHWLKYSHAAKIAFPSIALHFFVSFILMGFIFSGTL